MEIGRTEPRNGKWRWYSTPGLTGQKKKKKKKRWESAPRGTPQSCCSRRDSADGHVLSWIRRLKIKGLLFAPEGWHHSGIHPLKLQGPCCPLEASWIQSIYDGAFWKDLSSEKSVLLIDSTGVDLQALNNKEYWRLLIIKTLQLGWGLGCLTFPPICQMHSCLGIL
jgi:hypothetical protein